MRLRLPALVAVATAALACPTAALELRAVSFPGPDGVTLHARLAMPAIAGPVPVVVALHGCGGLGRRPDRLPARDTDWALRLTGAGFAVLFPDSFGSRGLGPQCTVSDRTIRPAMRARDALAARSWLAGQPFAQQERVYAIGWSNGGSTALRLAGRREAAPPRGFREIIAFYPGCGPLLTAKQPWRPHAPTTILHGLADDWTPAEPCRELAAGSGVSFVGYPGAHHGFDSPGTPLRERRAAYGQRADGMVTVGTDPEAREKAIRAVMEILAR